MRSVKSASQGSCRGDCWWPQHSCAEEQDWKPVCSQGLWLWHPASATFNKCEWLWVHLRLTVTLSSMNQSPERDHGAVTSLPRWCIRRYQQLCYIFPFSASSWPHQWKEEVAASQPMACSRSVVRMSCHSHGIPCTSLCNAELRCPMTSLGKRCSCAGGQEAVSVSHTPTEYC